jgi:hypothetical protein
VLGNFSLRYSLRFWQAPHPWMFVPATLSMALAMGCAMRSTRSPRPVGFGRFLLTFLATGKVSGSGLCFRIIIGFFYFIRRELGIHSQQNLAI